MAHTYRSTRCASRRLAPFGSTRRHLHSMLFSLTQELQNVRQLETRDRQMVRAKIYKLLRKYRS